MSRQPWWTTKGLGAGVLLAAALGAWQAERVAERLGFGPGSALDVTTQSAEGSPASRDLPGRKGRAPWPGRAPVGPSSASVSDQRWAVPALAPALAAPWTNAEPPRDLAGPIATGLAPVEPEEVHGARLADEFRRLVRDLEFTPGLSEPLQQQPAKAPEPWRPDPDASDRPTPVIEAVSPAAAPAAGGAEVVIRGQHLRAAQVMFGTVVARLASVGPGRVTVVVPPSAPGQVRIALTNDDGHFALAPEPFTLQPARTP